MNKVDITGQRFGLLTAVRDAGCGAYKARVWLCLCDCGGRRMVPAAKLRSGAVTQCGCISKRAPYSKEPKVSVEEYMPHMALDHFLYDHKSNPVECLTRWENLT